MDHCLNQFFLYCFTDELDKLGSFEGHPDDHLTLVSTTQDNLYLGARNALFNFTISSDLINFSVSDLVIFITKDVWWIPCVESLI